LEISPSTHTESNAASRIDLTSPVTSATEYIFGLGSSCFTRMVLEWIMISLAGAALAVPWLIIGQKEWLTKSISEFFYDRFLSNTVCL
jgi:hypothetical protein